MKIKNVNLRKIIFNILKEEIEKKEIENIKQSDISIKSKKVFANILDDDYINNWKTAGTTQRPMIDNKVIHDGWDIPGVREDAFAYSPGFGTVLPDTKQIERDIWQENFRFYKKDEGFGEGHGISNTKIDEIKSKISTAEADLKKIKDEISNSNQKSKWNILKKEANKKYIEININNLKSDLENLINSNKSIPIKIEGGNIIYQAFPGLGYYNRSVNLQSGPKGLEDHWNADTGKYTGTPEQTKEIVNKMNVSQTVKNKWLECISVYSEKDRGSKYKAGPSMEEGAAGGSISLLIKDPEDETEFIYTCLHMQSVFISPGQKVKPGQKIGTYGTSGRSTGIHLHLILKGYSSRLDEGGNTNKKVLDHNEWKNFFSRMDAELYDRKLADVGISDLIKKQKQEEEDLKNKMDASRKPSARIKASDFTNFLKRSPEEESKYIEQQKKDLENLKENFKYKNLDEFVDRLNEKKKRKKKPNGMRSVKKRADNNPKITRMDFLPDDVLNKIAKEKNLDEFVNKLDERKKRKKKYTAKNIPNNYKSKVSKKARSSMAREMNKCAKTPRPKSCYDYWDADKKHDKAMSESIERFVNIINENNEAGISINDDESNTIYYIKSENGKFLIKKENEKDFIKYNVTFTSGLIRNKPLEIKHISRVKDKNGKDEIEITVVVYGIEYKKIITDEVKKEIIENYNKDLEKFTISGSLGSMKFQKMETSNLAKEEKELDRYIELLYEKKLSKKTKETLKKKAEKANMPLGALTSVYRKGLGAWLTGHRPGTPQHAWAMARVNSFIRGGKTRSVDKSEWKKVQKHRKK